MALIAATPSAGAAQPAVAAPRAPDTPPDAPAPVTPPAATDGSQGAADDTATAATPHADEGESGAAGAAGAAPAPAAETAANAAASEAGDVGDAVAPTAIQPAASAHAGAAAHASGASVGPGAAAPTELPGAAAAAAQAPTPATAQSGDSVPGTAPSPTTASANPATPAATSPADPETGAEAAGQPRGANVLADRPGITGSLIYWGHALNLSAVDRTQQPTYNPTYLWELDAVLRWNFNRRANLRLLVDTAVEWTDADSTVRRRQWLLEDMRLRFTYELPSTDLGPGHQLRYFVAGALSAPTSKASRAAGLYTAVIGRATAAWMADAPLAGMQHWLSLIALGNVRERETAGAPEAAHPVRLVGSPSAFDGRQGTTSATAWALSIASLHTLNLGPALWASLSLAYTWSRAFGFDDATIDLPTGAIAVGDQSTTHYRNAGYLGLSLSYMPTPYLIAAIELNDEFAERNPDGRLRGPLRAQDVFLGLSLMVLIEPLLPHSLTHPEA